MTELHPNRITDPADALTFLMGGRATFTLVSEKTRTRYTYRVSRKKEYGDVWADLWFVGVLAGPDNGADYTYIGFLKEGTGLIAGAKGKPAFPSFKALDWVLGHLLGGTMPEQLEFWHEGRCCMCNRTLTDPVSIENGIGPECAKKEVA